MELRNYIIPPPPREKLNQVQNIAFLLDKFFRKRWEVTLCSHLAHHWTKSSITSISDIPWRRQGNIFKWKKIGGFQKFIAQRLWRQNISDIFCGHFAALSWWCFFRRFKGTTSSDASTTGSSSAPKKFQDGGSFTQNYLKRLVRTFDLCNVVRLGQTRPIFEIIPHCDWIFENAE